MNNTLHIIGGGMAGSEAAWQAANLGQKVVIHEMRPKVETFAHRTGHLAEMVCSNSFRSDDDEQNAFACRTSPSSQDFGVKSFCATDGVA